MLIIITGVSGSGKSEYADRYAAGLPEIIKNIMWQPCSLSERKAE